MPYARLTAGMTAIRHIFESGWFQIRGERVVVIDPVTGVTQSLGRRTASITPHVAPCVQLTAGAVR